MRLIFFFTKVRFIFELIFNIAGIFHMILEHLYSKLIFIREILILSSHLLGLDLFLIE
jgi:hypothetical protein